MGQVGAICRGIAMAAIEAEANTLQRPLEYCADGFDLELPRASYPYAADACRLWRHFKVDNHFSEGAMPGVAWRRVSF